MPRTERTMPAQDRRYLKFKMERIKKEKRRGNRPAAHRHATELLQYFGINGSSRPIADALELDESGSPIDDMLEQFR